MTNRIRAPAAVADDRDARFCARPDTILIADDGNAADVTATLARRHRLTEEPERSARLPGWRVFRVPSSGAGALELAATLRKAGGVSSVELDYVPRRSPYAFTPDDTYFGEQWVGHDADRCAGGLGHRDRARGRRRRGDRQRVRTRARRPLACVSE
jgi:hypothetical protein